MTNRSTYYNIIFNNLKANFIGPLERLKEVAVELSYWKYIRSYKPEIRLTPEAITIDSKGRISISNNRNLTVEWKDNNGQVYLLKATAVNNLITYKTIDNPDFYLGILSGLMVTEKDNIASVDAYLGLSISWNFWFDFNLFLSVGYPGVCGGVSYNVVKYFDIFMGSAIDYDKDLNFIIGINSRL